MEILIIIIAIILTVALMCLPLWFDLIEKISIKRKFQKLEINSKWVLNDTNPFETRAVRIVTKQMGLDGKTPWVMYEYQSGGKNTMEFKYFLNTYTPVKQ